MNYGNGIALSEKLLDLVWLRQNITSNNIANVDTPGYKMKKLSFEEEMQTHLAGRGSALDIGKEIHRIQGRIDTVDTESSRLDY